MTPNGEQLFLHPGKLFARVEPAVIFTVLGSCVSVMLWDRDRRAGGMNHFLLPSTLEGLDPSGRFGDCAVPRLLDMMIRLGCDRRSLEARVVGGGSPVAELRGKNAIGDQNIDMAHSILRDLSIPVLLEDTGGALGRRVRFASATGRVEVEKIDTVRTSDWYNEQGKPLAAPAPSPTAPDRRRSA